MPPMKLKILYLLLSLSNLYDIFTRPVTRSSLSRLFELTTKRFYCLLINSHSCVPANQVVCPQIIPPPVTLPPIIPPPGTLPSTMPPTGSCPSGFTGTLPNPNNCNQYISCRMGTSRVKSCGPFKNFDVNLGFCIKRQFAQCA